MNNLHFVMELFELNLVLNGEIQSPQWITLWFSVSLCTFLDIFFMYKVFTNKYFNSL